MTAPESANRHEQIFVGSLFVTIGGFLIERATSKVGLEVGRDIGELIMWGGRLAFAGEFYNLAFRPQHGETEKTVAETESRTEPVISTLDLRVPTPVE